MSEDSGFIKKNKPQMNAQSHASGGRVHVCPAGHTCARSREPAGFRHDERRCGLDFFGSLGKGMVPKENLETLGNSPGLTPLSFGVDVRNRILNTGNVREGLSTTEFTEMLKNSSGLSPLRPFEKIKKEVLG